MPENPTVSAGVSAGLAKREESHWSSLVLRGGVKESADQGREDSAPKDVMAVELRTQTWFHILRRNSQTQGEKEKWDGLRWRPMVLAIWMVRPRRDEASREEEVTKRSVWQDVSHEFIMPS
jgi:hypothetical protein